MHFTEQPSVQADNPPPVKEPPEPVVPPPPVEEPEDAPDRPIPPNVPPIKEPPLPGPKPPVEEPPGRDNDQRKLRRFRVSCARMRIGPRCLLTQGEF